MQVSGWTGTVYWLISCVQQHTKDMRDSLQPSSRESGQEDVLQAEQNKHRKRDRNSEDE
jgi:hypothetical protein